VPGRRDVGVAVCLVAEAVHVIHCQEENISDKIYCEEEDDGEVAQKGEGSR
jgi:hypothetical protein